MIETQFVIGILAAIVVFLFQELIRDFMAGVRFRRRLAADVSIIRAEFTKLIPQCQGELAEIASMCEEPSLSPVWANSYEGFGDIVANAAHITPKLLPVLMSFYDACSRFEEIRSTHNRSLVELSTKVDDNSDLLLGLVINLTRDMLSVSREIVATAELLCAKLDSRYGWDDELHDLLRMNAGA